MTTEAGAGAATPSRPSSDRPARARGERAPQTFAPKREFFATDLSGKPVHVRMSELFDASHEYVRRWPGHFQPAKIQRGTEETTSEPGRLRVAAGAPAAEE